MVIFILSLRQIPHAEVVELADASDSKSEALRGVRVRVPPSAPIRKDLLNKGIFFIAFDEGSNVKEPRTNSEDTAFEPGLKSEPCASRFRDQSIPNPFKGLVFLLFL